MKNGIVFMFLILILLPACKEKELDIVSPEQTPAVENVILLIGDGMGMAHITTLMIERGYTKTAFERANANGFLTTYSANSKVTDSAAAGTALACGHKTNNGMLGMSPNGEKWSSFLKVAAQKKQKTGLIVTCELTNATPAAFYANVSSRTQENEILSQLTDAKIDLLAGGGMSNNNNPRYIDSVKQVFRNNGYYLPATPSEFSTYNLEKVALFMAEYGCLPPIIGGRDTTLMVDVVERALEYLSNESSFFLMIEGSQIDLQSHTRNILGVLGEMDDFERMVRCAFDFADQHPETLVIVTADHETGGITLGAGSTGDFLPNSGIHFTFSTAGHTGVMVPLYAYGPGASEFIGIKDNTELFEILQNLLGW